MYFTQKGPFNIWYNDIKARILERTFLENKFETFVNYTS